MNTYGTLKMSKIMIVTEKPTAALKIASSLADTHPVKKVLNKVPYYELTHKGKNIVVVCAVGHLFNLAEKEKKGWTYPVFKLEWQPSYKVSKSSAFTKAYISVIEKQAKNCNEFYVATDKDTEGELIGANILRFIVKRKDGKRMEFSTLTKDELINSFEKAKPHIDFPLFEAAETRHFLDFYWGINLSRALTLAVKSTGHFRILSSGRVQGPALKILSDREKEIKKFKSEPYWEIFLDGLIHNEKIKAQHKADKFWDKNKASEIIKKTKGHQGIISDVKKIEFEKTPPIPFDLTTLQTEAYRTLKVQPKHTLELAQELYISGLISYPRTSSQKLPPSINYKKILSSLIKQKEYTKLVGEILNFKQLSPIQGKSDDPAHPAIYPTGEIKTLQAREKQIYDLIVHRFLSAFAPNSKRETVTIEIDVNKEPFVLSGTKTIEQGWQKFYGKYVGHKDLELPEAQKDDPVKVKKITLEEKETQPPKRYTPASIIKELTKKNLGTKATRAAIIESLYERNYIIDTSLEVTNLGLKIEDTLEKYCPEILDEKLTREFEEDMDKIREKKIKGEIVLENAKKFLTKTLKHFKENEIKIGKGLEEASVETRDEMTLLGPCHVCKEGQLRITFNRRFKSYFISCNAYPNCKTTFSLPWGLPKKTGQVCKECGYPVVKIIRKGKRPIDYCINKECKLKKQYFEEQQKEAKSKKPQKK